MNKYNYPTTILSGKGALEAFVETIEAKDHKKPLIVTDATLVECGLVDKLINLLKAQNISYAVFDGTHPNPTEEDVIQGTSAYKDNNCDFLMLPYWWKQVVLT